MNLIAEIAFWISVALVFHSYILFPSILRLWPKRKSTTRAAGFEKTQLPRISILISAYNEEKVMADKLDSVLDTNYPSGHIEVLIGSDASVDQTNAIVEKYAVQHPGIIRFYPYQSRRGKPNVVNDLVALSGGEILILTDANVIFEPETLIQLVSPFSDPDIGLVDSQMINLGLKREGISFQEKAYISREVRIKHDESRLWGTMMGPFGGCYAIRKTLFHPIPANFLVDDFFLNMMVIESGFKAINNPAARVYEDVSNDLGIEFRRKVRIATGNFQNLKRFSHLLWPLWTGRSFSFISHKIIRWFGPLFMLISTISLVILSSTSALYLNILAAYLVLLVMPVIDFGLKKLNLHIPLLRFLTHFLAMNLAMGVGFFRYLKGVKSNVWQPTKRHQ